MPQKSAGHQGTDEVGLAERIGDMSITTMHYAKKPSPEL